MAFRNSVKATLLLESEQPRLRSGEPDTIGETGAAPAPAAKRPPENHAQRPSENLAQRPSENLAQRPSESVAQRPSESVAQRPSESVAQRSPESVAQRSPESIAHRPPENLVQRSPESVAQRPSESVAHRPSEQAAQPPAGDAFPAAAWHARAEELCAMADSLPSESSWSLISKIAGLYDEIARDAGWSEEDAPPVTDPGAADEPEILADEEPEILAPPAEPRPAPACAYPRRPLPSGRAIARRRA